MSVLSRPTLKVDVAFPAKPTIALTDPSLVWTDISGYAEVDKGVLIQRRRANELDEPSPGTLSLTLNNGDGRFTRLNTSSPYYPYVKHNRLIRVQALWNPATSVNMVSRRQATGGQADPTTVGFHVPSGTKSSPTGTAIATATGTTSTLLCADGDASDMEVGDVVTLGPATVTDPFTRTVPIGWGSAPSGQTWVTSGGLAADYSVTGSLGRVSLGSVAVRRFTSVGAALADVSMKASVTVPVTATGGSISAGVKAREVDDNNFYLFQLLHNTAGSISLEILKRVGGTFTILANVPNFMAHTPGTPTQVRAQCVGDQLSARIWTGATEPNVWHVTATDSTFTSGPVGTHSNLLTGNTNALPVNVDYDDFTVTPMAAGITATYRQVTGMSSAAGTTTITFTPAASIATAASDVLTRYRQQWDTGIQAATGARLSLGASNTASAGPDAIQVTAGLPYTWSFWTSRGTNAISVSPRILWYDKTGALLSESTGPTTALTTALQRISYTDTAPVNAAYARPAIANETVFPPPPGVAFRDSATAISSTGALVITIPSTVQAGDGLLLWVGLDDGTYTATTPAGWTAVGNRTTPLSRSYLFRKVATSTDASSVLALSTTGVKVLAILAAYSGSDTTNPVHQSASVAENVYGTSHVTQNVTTTLPNCWIVSAAFDHSWTTSLWTQPAGDTKRAEAYNTGPSTTGAVSDNNAAVAAGTYGLKTWTSNVASLEATMWTVAVPPSTTAGSSSGTVQVTGMQFEQAAAASAWAIPPTIYTRFVGHVDSWPTAWEGGVRPLTAITATDRQKLLNDAKVRAALTEQALFTGPVAYYPLGEETGATTAGNIAATQQPSLSIVTRGTVTDDMLQFGAGTGPGTDAQPALVLAPTSFANGKALRGPLTTPLGGAGVTGISVVVCFKSTSTVDRAQTIVGADDGNPTDNEAVGLLTIYGNPIGGYLRAHLRLPDGLDTERTSLTNWFDGRTHMAVAVANLAAGNLEIRLYVDGASEGVAGFPPTVLTEFPQLTRANVGCGAADGIINLYSGTVSHALYVNRAITSAEVTDLWTAARDGFAGDLPGPRVARIAAWKGLTATSFQTGVEQLATHPSAEAELLEAFKLVARSEGGLFFMARDGYATMQARSQRTNAPVAFTVAAHQVDGAISWAEDPQLIGNDVTVKHGFNGENAVRVTDQASIDDYGVQPAEIDTILATDTQAINRAAAYLARYREPISRPDALVIDALADPSLFTSLLGTEFGTKVRVTGLPTGAPASNVDLFVEGIGEEINQEHWLFGLDASPAGFDFGMILDDPVRGLLDSNYLGW